jgi:hypothetical protein
VFRRSVKATFWATLRFFVQVVQDMHQREKSGAWHRANPIGASILLRENALRRIMVCFKCSVHN